MLIKIIFPNYGQGYDFFCFNLKWVWEALCKDVTRLQWNMQTTEHLNHCLVFVVNFVGWLKPSNSWLRHCAYKWSFSKKTQRSKNLQNCCKDSISQLFLKPRIKVKPGINSESSLHIIDWHLTKKAWRQFLNTC